MYLKKIIHPIAAKRNWKTNLHVTFKKDQSNVTSNS